MTYLRYYVPVVIAANKRGINSTFYVGKNNKYNCPSRFSKKLNELTDKFGIKTKNIEEISDSNDPNIVVEGAGLGMWSERSQTYSLSYCTDYTHLYKKYIDKIDYLVLPSRYFATGVDRSFDNKILCLGSPKFDTKIDSIRTKEKYGLKQDKYVTLIYPRLRDISNFDIDLVLNHLNDLGYGVLIKSREKDPVQIPVGSLNNVFYDTDWYPHTSMELMEVSDFIINTSSMAIEEAICIGKPTINFHIKPFNHTFPEIFSNDMCINRKNYNYEQFNVDISFVKKISNDASISERVRNEFFDNVGNTSEKILDIIFK